MDFIRKPDNIAHLFEQTGIAEDTILLYRGDPNFDRINKCFKCFQSRLLRNAPDWLFRSHCKEICDRIRSIQYSIKANIGRKRSIPYSIKADIGRKMEIPTRAELVMMLSETSITIPLNNDATDIYSFLLRKICEEEGIEFPLKGEYISMDNVSEHAMEDLCDAHKDEKRAEIVYTIIKDE